MEPVKQPLPPSNQLGLIRCLTLVIRVSTQHHIQSFQKIEKRLWQQNLSRPQMSVRASGLSMRSKAGARVPSQGSGAFPAIIVAKSEGDTSLPNSGCLRRYTCRVSTFGFERLVNIVRMTAPGQPNLHFWNLFAAPHHITHVRLK